MNNTPSSPLRKNKTNRDYISDITKAYHLLCKKGKLYHLTLENIPTKSVRDLSFQMNNRFFNNLHKQYGRQEIELDYLYIIEYGGVISKQNIYNTPIQGLGLHAHCIIHTQLCKETLKHYAVKRFGPLVDSYIQDITRSNTKDHLLQYLLKQERSQLMTKDSYNYKIMI